MTNCVCPRRGHRQTKKRGAGVRGEGARLVPRPEMSHKGSYFCSGLSRLSFSLYVSRSLSFCPDLFHRAAAAEPFMWRPGPSAWVYCRSQPAGSGTHSVILIPGNCRERERERERERIDLALGLRRFRRRSCLLRLLISPTIASCLQAKVMLVP